MGMRGLGDVGRVRRRLENPIAEGGAEPVHRHPRPAHAPQHRRERHVRQRPALRAEEDQPLAIAEGPHLLEDLHRPIGQRHAVHPARLHPRPRHGPERGLGVDLGPARAPHLARAGGRQDQELERPRGQPRATAQLGHEGRRLGPWQRPVMPPREAVALGQQLGQMAAPARRVRPLAQVEDGRRIEHPLDPPAQSRGRLGQRQPDRLEDGEHIGRALLHKSGDGQGSPFPGQTYPATSVMGVPSAVKPFRTATRTWNSAT
jgi:hypothetical protein